MKLVITTQYMENYGDSESPHWKFKGGEDYVIEDLDWADYPNADFTALIEKVRHLVEMENEVCESYIIGWKAVNDDEFVGMPECQGYSAVPAEVLEFDRTMWPC